MPHHDDVDLTDEERVTAVTLDPDWAPVPVIEEQPPPKQDGWAQLAVGAAWWLAALILAGGIVWELTLGRAS